MNRVHMEILSKFVNSSYDIRRMILNRMKSFEKYPSESKALSLEEYIGESIDFLDGDLVWNYRGEKH